MKNTLINALTIKTNGGDKTMSFPYKDNTNTGGMSLCKTCAYCDDNCNSNGYIWCMKEGEYRKNVGICNKYKGRCENG